ncbi:MAG: hypothetical protein ACI4PK_02600 [Oscillospiraceae bacterium]
MLVKGTQANPYKIKTTTDFSLVAKFPGAYFELENDIDFKHMFIMHDKNYCFKYSFNGKGHQIMNVKTKNAGGGLSGIFGRLAKEAIVQNLTVNNAFTTGEGYVGVIAGESWGKVTNCCVKNVIVEGYYNVGGLIGVNRKGGKAILCSAEVTLVGNINIGGIIGDNQDGGEICFCRSLGKLCGLENIGGIAGRNCGAVIDSGSVVKLSGKKAYGQLVGLNRGLIDLANNELIREYCNQVFAFAEYIGRNCLTF